MLFCSHSAFGQRVYIDDFSAGYGADPKAIDLGFNDVYWATRNVGASGPNGYGTYFTWSEASTWNSSHNYPNWVGYWRTPTQSEQEALKSLSHDENVTSGSGVRVKASDAVFIEIPASGYYFYSKVFGTVYYTRIEDGNTSYLWSCTPQNDNDDRAYYLIYNTHTHNITGKVNVIDGAKVSKLPIRPVIDKVTITVTTAGGNTIQKSYPKGTKIKIYAFMDECHKVAHWTKSSINDPDSTITPNNTSGDNGDIEITIIKDVTYTAYFKKKKYSVSAYIKYGDSDAEPSSQIGDLECGQYATISVPIDNCYVFQGWEGPGITGRLAAGQNNNGYSCNVDNSVSPTQARLTIPNIDSNTQLNRDYTAIFSIKTTNIRATTDSNKGWVGLNVWK